MFSLNSQGSFKKSKSFLANLSKSDMFSGLDKYGSRGVEALSKATPTESGLTASSWTYDVERGKGFATIKWSNTNTRSGVNVAILLQYGHGTGTGGYVAGRDYINPAIQPIFDEIAADVWKKVSHG